MTDISNQNYYYGKQIRRYIMMFMAIFMGTKVQSGKNDYNSASDLIDVPVVYGSKDRVVAAILTANTQNKLIRVPMFAVKRISIDRDDVLRHGSGQVNRSTRLPLGETFPDGLETIEIMNPVPWRMRMELSIIASSTDQHLELIEPILMLFNPVVQIQTSDAFADITKLTEVEIESHTDEEDYPPGVARRLITSSFVFTMPIYLVPPANFVKNYIKQIKMRLSVDGDGTALQAAMEAAREAFIDSDYTTVADVHDIDIPPQ